MKLTGDGVVWWNGALVPWSQAQVHVATHALHYASSVFEGIRSYPTPSGPAVLQLVPHVRRMIDSCRIVNLPLTYDEQQLARAVLDTVRANGHDSSYIRPLAYRGYGQLGVDPSKCPVDVAVIVIEHGAHFGVEALEHGIDMCVSSWRRLAPDTLPALAKSAANYLNSQLVILEAKANGFTDGIALDSAGFVSEGSGANVFLVSRGVLWTPDLGSSVLQGVTRNCVMQLARDAGLEIRETHIPREMLYVADEVFLTGTAAEVTPVRSIDRKPIGAGKRGPITARLQREFGDIVHGAKPDRHGWMTPVA
ncbi:MAG: branched-chain amino acid transaminase [Planctomycetes bacterium]|nr:branched-chain amino acid transaminase [Planctomycetota bacterium]